VQQEPAPPPAEVAQPRGPEQQIHPYQGYQLFLSAVMKGDRPDQDGNPRPYLAGYLTVTQNGQPIRQVSFRDLTDAGYTITYESPTVIALEYKGYDLGYVISALPTVSLASKTPDKAVGG
jgi:zona occludens toxin